MPPARVIDAAGATHVGKVRRDNEDAFVCDPRAGVFVLCDGMGGEPGGEVAASVAAAAAHAALARGGGCPTAREAALAARAAVVAAATSGPRDRRRMGTTLVAAAARPRDGGALELAHVGDSRAYLWRGGRLAPLTRDHGVGHMLSRALAVETPGEPDARRVPLAPGDALLLCSDGLTKPLADAAVAAALVGRGGAAAACRRLIAAALAAGGPDNVTVIVVLFR